MGRAGNSKTRSSPGEDRPFECTVELDEGTLELADDALAIALWSIEGMSGRGWGNGREHGPDIYRAAPSVA